MRSPCFGAPKRGEADADALAHADWTLEARMAAALDRLGLQAGPETLLSTLSGGQRTRVGLAALVFDEPDFILLDEPTNNLDRDGRRAVIELLAGWRGGAIVVSHDRELLETVDAIVELDRLRRHAVRRQFQPLSRTQGARARGGAARPRRRRAARRPKSPNARRQRPSARPARTAPAKAAGQGRHPAHPARTRCGTAARPPAAATRGWPSAQREQALDDAASARERIEVLQPLTVAVPPTGLPAGKTVLRIDAASAATAIGR